MASVLAAVVALSFACGPGEGGDSGGRGSSDDAAVGVEGGPGTAPVPDGASSGAEGAGTEAGADERSLVRGDTVFVYMDEYFIDMPLTLPPGEVVFQVRNAGFEEHNFELLRDDSLLYSFENPLNPAQTRSLPVTLEPGEYDVLCTVSGHEGRGMQEVLTVTEDGS